MASKWMKDAYDRRNRQQNNEIPINFKKKKNWIVLSPDKGIRGKRLLYPIGGSVNLNTFWSTTCHHLQKFKLHIFFEEVIALHGSYYMDILQKVRPDLETSNFINNSIICNEKRNTNNQFLS